LAFILRALIAHSNSRWARRISQKSSRKILKKEVSNRNPRIRILY
jgi:hypothetical protein